MTAFAFILGCVPLWVASGAGGVARQILGTVVIGGMLAATSIALFLVPVTFSMAARIGSFRQGAQWQRGPALFRDRSSSSRR
jgi:Cu/Ag efflux pump CusA